MALKVKETVSQHNYRETITKIQQEFQKLTDDEKVHLVIFTEEKKNPALPQLKYLNGIVLKTISDGLPDQPPVAALYNYFEELFAPILQSTIDGKQYEYFDLKKCKVKDFDIVIGQVINFAKTEWGIDVLSKIESQQPEASEAYIGAYANAWEGLEDALKSQE